MSRFSVPVLGFPFRVPASGTSETRGETLLLRSVAAMAQRLQQNATYSVSGPENPRTENLEPRTVNLTRYR
jgi:hypothetical protein